MQDKVNKLFSLLSSATGVITFLAVPALAAVNTQNLTAVTPAQLAQTLVPGAAVSNVGYRGSDRAAGSFTDVNFASGIGIPNGVILSSGDIEAAELLPNDDASGKASTDNVLAGDPDLEPLIALQQTWDGAVLEFDFTPGPLQTLLTLPLVFASEEYVEFVGAINDGVAVWVNGANVAVVPGSNDPISIFTVNPFVNPALFNSNDPSNFGGNPPFGNFVRYDGFTDVVTMRVPVEPGGLNHIKIVIADEDDPFTDSALFLGQGVFSDLAPEIEALVTKYYNDILQRVPDLPGLTFWTSEVLRVVALGVNIGEGFSALGRVFFSSPEYIGRGTSNAQYVIDLYQTFLNRAPDPTGQAFWEAEVTSVGRDVVFNSFAFSVEFGLFLDTTFNLSPSRPETNMVNDFYRGILNRLPDDGGFLNWLGQMQGAQCAGAQTLRNSAAQLAQLFVSSAEYGLRGRTDVQFVEDMYNAFLRRGASMAEFNHWVSQLAGGSTRLAVLEAFVDSAEFQIRVQTVVDAGCVVL